MACPARGSQESSHTWAARSSGCSEGSRTSAAAAGSSRWVQRLPDRYSTRSIQCAEAAASAAARPAAPVRRAVLSGAVLSGAVLSGAVLSGAERRRVLCGMGFP
ncbi:pentapeptide repeat-containing protein [Blastococcus sp. TML/M2B]|uniref:pentapeptide repeat-containing protein n=1 Tax=Blastococcus sp. TML/M2B TaxID=2798727 RepID=UPI0019094786|nr:pentapeptide repeat-containing protein [Blastococcus sp. TML/M2B]